MEAPDLKIKITAACAECKKEFTVDAAASTASIGCFIHATANSVALPLVLWDNRIVCAPCAEALQ